MLRCTNCRSEIVAKEYPTEDGYAFCSGLCRYEWRRKGKQSPFIADAAAQPQDLPATISYRFAIEPPGFEGRRMAVQLSFWRLPYLYLDRARMSPTKTRRFRRRREYLAASNFGKSVVIHLQAEPLDSVPFLRIDGQIFRVCRKLKVWEQIWIGLPFMLFMQGGLLGGLMGTSAVFANSTLLRRVGHWLARFVVTGTVSLAAFQGYIAVAVALVPTMARLELKLAYQDTVTPEGDLLTSRIWISAGRFDRAGNAVTVDPLYDTGARIYFKGDGRFTTLSNQGFRADGTWLLDFATQQLIVIYPPDTMGFALTRIEPGFMVLRGVNFETRYQSEVVVPIDQDSATTP